MTLSKGLVYFNSCQLKSLLSKKMTITFSLLLLNVQVSAEDLRCYNCNLGKYNSPGLSYESPEICGAERNYLENSINEFKDLDINGYYTETRDENTEVIPRKCVLYTMRSFWKDKGLSPIQKRFSDLFHNVTANILQQKEVLELNKYTKDPGLYAQCSNRSEEQPERIMNKACVTRDYVNVVYNSLLDVADCMNVPAKFIIPKLANESGLHINAFGLVNDGGIGQFTEQALRDVQQNYDLYISGIKNSKKESCQRLSSIPGAVISSKLEIKTSDNQRCHSIAGPTNPIRSLIYYAIFYHSTKRNAESAWRNTTDQFGRNAVNLLEESYLNVDRIMNEKGLSATQAERYINHRINKIKEMLFVMAYNAGPNSPARALIKWLNLRESKSTAVPITDQDFNMNFWPEKKINQLAKGDTRANALLQEKSINAMGNMKRYPQLSFPEFLFSYYNSKYIAAVKAQANKLDKTMGKNQCTEKGFLEF